MTIQTLITGGAGFIGSNIARQLLVDGHDVRIVDNFLSGHRTNVEQLDGVEFITGDIRDEKVVARAMTGVEAVFHLAASVGNKRAIDHPIEDSDINVIGTLRVLEAARRAGVRKIVASSSAGAYGELRTIPIKEDHPVEPDTPYGASKLCAEKHCLAYAKLYDIEAVCLRYFNVYGPNQRYDAYGNVIPKFVFQMLAGDGFTIFGDGEQTRDFVNVADVVQANIKAAMSHGVSAAFNIGSGTQITVNELAQRILRDGEPDTKVTYGAERPGDVRHSLADISAARNAFGYDPVVTFDTGLPEYIAWAREEHVRT